jgi:hypothetical protein
MRWMLVIVLATHVARAESLQVVAPPPQVQLDLGLSVIGAGYEHPVGRRFAVQAEAFVFGTYFLPWFDLGDRVAGMGGGVRLTRFARDDGRGLYVTPYLRVASVGEAITDFDGIAVTAGVFVGWAIGLGERVDLRLGGGAQWIYVEANELDASTPFLAADITLGYRL